MSSSSLKKTKRPDPQKPMDDALKQILKQHLTPEQIKKIKKKYQTL